MAKKLYQKHKRLNYKRYRCRLEDDTSMALNSMNLLDSIPTIYELLDTPIYNFVNLSENNCGYSGTTEYLIVNYLHPLFIKSKAAESQEDNQNLCLAMNVQFADEYW